MKVAPIQALLTVATLALAVSACGGKPAASESASTQPTPQPTATAKPASDAKPAPSTPAPGTPTGPNTPISPVPPVSPANPSNPTPPAPVPSILSDLPKAVTEAFHAIPLSSLRGGTQRIGFFPKNLINADDNCSSFVQVSSVNPTTGRRLVSTTYSSPYAHDGATCGISWPVSLNGVVKLALDHAASKGYQAEFDANVALKNLELQSPYTGQVNSDCQLVNPQNVGTQDLSLGKSFSVSCFLTGPNLTDVPVALGQSVSKVLSGKIQWVVSDVPAGSSAVTFQTTLRTDLVRTVANPRISIVPALEWVPGASF